MLACTGFLILCLSFFVVSCAKQSPNKKISHKPTPTEKKEESKPVEQVPIKPAPPVPAAINPKREASQKIVEAGVGYLDHGEVDRASQAFQEAINVDGDNGVAYFYLAKVKDISKDYDDALSLLERASDLLNGNRDWEDAILNLKTHIAAEMDRKDI